jgi:hypothetical protein
VFGFVPRAKSVALDLSLLECLAPETPAYIQSAIEHAFRGFFTPDTQLAIPSTRRVIRSKFIEQEKIMAI